MLGLNKSSFVGNPSTYSRFNLSFSESDVRIFVKEYRERILEGLKQESDNSKSLFKSFANVKSVTDLKWVDDNYDTYIKDTENAPLVKQHFLSVHGFICCMIFTPDGENVICGHSSGCIQVYIMYELHAYLPTGELGINLVGLDAMESPEEIDDGKFILSEYKKDILYYFKNERSPSLWYPMFYEGKLQHPENYSWIAENNKQFLVGTPNKFAYYRWLSSEMGAITALTYCPSGTHIIVGHSSGLIQMRHGSTGTVLCTLRCIQFPPKPIYALEYSNFEERVCYAACSDGIVYRIDIPLINASVEHPPAYCIRADPALECLNTQFYGTSGISSYASPFITVRSAPLSFGLTADGSQMPVGFADTSIRIFDMETQTQLIQYKVHKLRIQFIPKKLQRMHFGQVCALRCHPDRPQIFASGAWDKTLRIWDTRCKVGCMMTFEGVNVCNDSIDLNRNHCIAGSWQTTEGLSLWDIAAKKRICVVRVQNRRPDIDGEYVYACRYWHSDLYNRKGKYAIIGGSGTKCVEVINLHNRYIACSYPAAGTVLAIASYQERIAFGGTDTTFNIVNFYDPKHEKEKYTPEVEPDFDYAHAVGVFGDSDDELETM